MNREQKMFQDIKDELVTARTIYPGNKHQLTALNEEVGELNQAMLDHENGKQTAHQVYREAVQAAAMAIRVAIDGDHSFKYNPKESFSLDGIYLDEENASRYQKHIDQMNVRIRDMKSANQIEQFIVDYCKNNELMHESFVVSTLPDGTKRVFHI